MKSKGIIKHVGTFKDGKPVGWAFDCQGQGAAFEVIDDGSVLYAGYTIEELQQITHGGER